MAVTITYPNHGRPWLYAFNVAEIKVAGLTPADAVTISVGDFSEVREADNDGEITANVSAYLQALFTPSASEDFDTYKTGEFVVKYGETTNRKSFSVIYGAHNPGENEMPTDNEVHIWPAIYQDLTILRRYPGVISRYTDDQTQIGEDESALAGQTIKTGLADWLTKYDDDGNVEARADYFTDVQRVTASVRRQYNYRVHWHEEADGLFLRWLDRFGRFQYWRFDIGNDERKTATYGSEMPYNYTEGDFRYITGAYQGKSQGRAVSCVAPLVNFSRFEFFGHLMTSPAVYAYTGGEWVPVSVAAGSNTWSRDKNEHLQDFELSVVFPELVTITF